MLPCLLPTFRSRHTIPFVLVTVRGGRVREPQVSCGDFGRGSPTVGQRERERPGRYVPFSDIFTGKRRRTFRLRSNNLQTVLSRITRGRSTIAAVNRSKVYARCSEWYLTPCLDRAPTAFFKIGPWGRPNTAMRFTRGVFTEFNIVPKRSCVHGWLEQSVTSVRDRRSNVGTLSEIVFPYKVGTVGTRPYF